MVKRILALSLLMVGLVACGGQEADVAELSTWSAATSIAEHIANNCEIFPTDDEQKHCAVIHNKLLKTCPYPLKGMCHSMIVAVEACETENLHLDSIVTKMKKVHEAITLSPDSSVTFDFSVSDSAIVKVEHDRRTAWTFTALKAGTTSITLVRTTPGIQTCSYTQAINISE